MKQLVLLCILCTLCGSSIAADKPFAKVKDNPKLPRVLLIGDSISIGYTVQTRALLKGKANVHRVPTNAGDTGRGINGLPKWLKTVGGKWDVIHFNWGLWDLCYRHPKSKNQGRRDKVNGTITHTLEQYTANLEKLVAELNKTKAKLIFATTTPVPDGEFGRKLGDDRKYNTAATQVMKRYGIEINDLHAAMAGKMNKYGVKPGDVHFTKEGSQLLANQVANAISVALKED
ncbi:MAG: SGNH/GDSL hydrolase family protein [Limisphaerales bacterium]